MCQQLCRYLDSLAEPLCLVYLWLLSLVFNLRYATHISESQHVGWILLVASAAVQLLSALVWCAMPPQQPGPTAGVHLVAGVLCLSCSFAYMQDAAARMLLALLLGLNAATHGAMAAAINRRRQSALSPALPAVPEGVRELHRSVEGIGPVFTDFVDTTHYSLDRSDEGTVDL